MGQRRHPQSTSIQPHISTAEVNVILLWVRLTSSPVHL
jgi:hypothetical protein